MLRKLMSTHKDRQFVLDLVAIGLTPRQLEWVITNYRVKNIRCLSSLFLWDSTREGWQFWSEKSKKFNDIQWKREAKKQRKRR
jgi:hypothetical protein